MTKYELAKSAINHVQTNELPFIIDFTPEARNKLVRHYGAEDFADIIDDTVLRVACPWWAWAELPANYRDFDPPDEFPKIRGMGSFEQFFEHVQSLKEKTGKYVLVTIYSCFFEKAWTARGFENLLGDFSANKDHLRKLFADIIRRNTSMLEMISSTEYVDGILLGSDWGSQRGLLMNPELWREFIRPGEQEEYDIIHAAGKDVWVHSCGDIVSIIPDLIEMGVDVLNPIQPECMNIFELKKDFGDKLTFWGGISTQQALPYGSPDDIRRETVDIMRRMGVGGGYFAAPSQFIQGDVPLENTLALIDTLKTFRLTLL